MTRLLLLTAGSRGDVVPFVHLAREATRHGHEVVLGLPDHAGADTDDLEVRSLHADFAALIDAQGVSPVAAWRNFRSVIRPTMSALLAAALEVALETRPDVIVAHPKVLTAQVAATALGVPLVVGEIVPALTPTRAFPAAGVAARDLGPFNRLTFRATASAGAMFGGDVRAAAKRAGVTGSLAPAAASLVPVSPALLPRPADWPETTVLTGPWLDGRPAPELTGDLRAFAHDGPFTYVGFGSMAAGDPVARAEAVAAALRRTGRRGVLATGWGGLDVPAAVRGGDLLVVRDAPHASLLPHAEAAVHHGGAGTVHAAAAAGIPSIVVPFIADQPWWGHLLAERGLSPEPVPAKHLTARRLATALDAIPAFADANRPLAAALASEHGAATALAHVESLA
ncbi:nucleotide disphospho-sugar-binding domain-containing protein [Agromyces sp. SYSU T00194]|uniref:nucleotide disphospho-sugar-binding domain-containing protein n=1 Tax=Agromyces chitinivorans TaxID=3158560 RepID=UPI00339A6C6A